MNTITKGDFLTMVKLNHLEVLTQAQLSQNTKVIHAYMQKALTAELSAEEVADGNAMISDVGHLQQWEVLRDDFTKAVVYTRPEQVLWEDAERGEFGEIVKAKSGTYKLTTENKKLGRVGQKYGESKGGDEKESKVDKVIKLLREAKTPSGKASPNFVNDFAWKHGIEDLTSEEVVKISDTYSLKEPYFGQKYGEAYKPTLEDSMRDPKSGQIDTKKRDDLFKESKGKTFSNSYHAPDDVVRIIGSRMSDISTTNEYSAKGKSTYIYKDNKHIGSLLPSKKGGYELVTDLSLDEFKNKIQPSRVGQKYGESKDTFIDDLDKKVKRGEIDKETASNLALTHLAKNKKIGGENNLTFEEAIKQPTEGFAGRPKFSDYKKINADSKDGRNAKDVWREDLYQFARKWLKKKMGKDPSEHEATVLYDKLWNSDPDAKHYF